MYHPTRGGTRGGAAEFSWDAVRQDKHREFYLGHSIQAPTGRWLHGRDVQWYNKDESKDEGEAADKRRQELLEVKRREMEEMDRRLGIQPALTKEERKAAKKLAKREVKEQRREERRKRRAEDGRHRHHRSRESDAED
ncbi:hypothetical protein FA10DRAFT_244209, partial [Acaromyces ingoldii]